MQSLPAQKIFITYTIISLHVHISDCGQIYLLQILHHERYQFVGYLKVHIIVQVIKYIKKYSLKHFKEFNRLPFSTCRDREGILHVLLI